MRKKDLRHRVPLIVSAALAMSALSACQTTGDPRDGGLLHWSKHKALDRQRDKENADAQAQQDSASAQQQQRSLQQQQVSLQSDAARLAAELDPLLTENTRLTAVLHDLLQQKQLQEADLARLNSMLARNEQLRRTVLTPNAALPAVTRPEAVSQQNNELNQEILLLLRR